MAPFTRPPNVPPEATVDAYGNWFMPNGDFITSSGGQTAPTAAQAAATPGPLQTDANGKQYRIVSGQKWYLPPMSGPTGDLGGGLIHGRVQWNPQTGAYDTPLDWGKILSMVTAGIITAGAADAALAATPALSATAPAGASASTAAAGSTIPGATYGAGGVVSNFAGVAPEVAGGGTVAGLSYGDLVKYGLPVAGNLIGGVIQAKASGAATDAQQRYLEEALAYQKESDAYARKIDASRYADSRADIAKADVRYGDYQGRIAPFIANGTSSNDRMAALLGLPARAPSAGGSSGPPASQRVPTDAATQAAIRRELQAVNSSDDPAAWDEYLASHGDSAAKNWDYWKHRIDIGDGVGKGYSGAPAAAPSTPPPASSAPAAAPPATSTSAALVQLRGPDGSVRAVPPDQVDHYKQLGATVIGAAA